MTESENILTFLHQMVQDDIDNKRVNVRHGICTRFPPEPNGYLHIGHAKSLCVNFDIARFYKGSFYLRFDDTNPIKEEAHYVEAIQKDITWLGFDWQGAVRFASDYFEQLYNWALHLIDKGLAYVCDLTPEEARSHRGTLTEPGTNSPYRNRSVAENTRLFAQMRAGDFAQGACVLRAKIDMSHPNINMRDPILYRILHDPHHRTTDNWCIYPTYDFAHGQEDAIEYISHSFCTLEFADHRPLYDWFLENLPVPHKPRQQEFARLNLSHTLMSKRKLKELVDNHIVDGWDDPRMPTLAGLRRRGVRPEAIQKFCRRIGVTKADSQIQMNFLETIIRDDLNAVAPRAMAVMHPLKVLLTNYPDDQEISFELPLHPQDPSLGTRKVPFSRELYIDKEDFAQVAPKKWKRLAPDCPVRLRGGYVILLEKIIQDEQGKVIQLHCRYDPETLGKNPSDYKARGVIHWVSARHAITAEIRLYDRLFLSEKPESNDKEEINSESLVVLKEAKLEPALALAVPEFTYQFERVGYFCRDNKEKKHLVFNQTIGLRDSWSKISKT